MMPSLIAPHCPESSRLSELAGGRALDYPARLMTIGAYSSVSELLFWMAYVSIPEKVGVGGSRECAAAADPAEIWSGV